MLPVAENWPVDKSYKSADTNAGKVARAERKTRVPPPAINTLPVFKRVPVAPCRALCILFAVGLVDPVTGLYISALLCTENGTQVRLSNEHDWVLLMPPARSTVPSPSRVAVCPERGVDMLPS